MLSPIVVSILTALAAVVVVATHIRLRRPDAGGHRVSRRVPIVHFVSGVLALILWVGVLVFPADAFLGGPFMGIVAIAFWWITAICGLLLLARWLPSKGRHAPKLTGRRWVAGPGLSLLGHLSMAAAVLVFTAAYLQATV